MTAAEYLPRERAAEFRSDLCSGRVIRRAESSLAHVAICGNLIGEIGNRLRPGPCRTLSCNMRVGVSRTEFFGYPDLLILCDRPQFDPRCDETLTNPRAIIEIVSPETAAYDLGKKFHNYQESPTVVEYVAVFEDCPFVMRYNRLKDNQWQLRFINGIDAVFALESVPVKIPLADVYRNVEFPPAPQPRTLSES